MFYCTASLLLLLLLYCKKKKKGLTSSWLRSSDPHLRDPDSSAKTRSINLEKSICEAVLSTR